MARIQRPFQIIQYVVLACGSVDQTNMVDFTVPGPFATLVQVSATTKTAGTGTGTFSLQIMRGPAGATAVSPASVGTLIDADAVTGTIHGQFLSGGAGVPTEGDRLAVKTVKTGTVSADATLIITLIWQM